MSNARTRYVNRAVSYLGVRENSTKHHHLVDVFNTVKPDGWAMTYSAAWCADYVSAIAIEEFGKADAKKYFPLSANCGTIIRKAKEMGIWVENDAYRPTKGDWILYDWQDSGYGDNTGSPDHVGIVKSVSGNTINVIEGNYSDMVKERKIQVNGRYIRGFVTPNFSKLDGTTSSPTTTAKTASKLTVDGEWGTETTLKTQKVLKTEQDGIVSGQRASCKKYLKGCLSESWEFKILGKGSPMVIAIQDLVDSKKDGLCGKETVKGIQKFVKSKGFDCGDVDGYMEVKTVKAWQKYINSKL